MDRSFNIALVASASALIASLGSVIAYSAWDNDRDAEAAEIELRNRREADLEATTRLAASAIISTQSYLEMFMSDSSIAYKEIFDRSTEVKTKLAEAGDVVRLSDLPTNEAESIAHHLLALENLVRAKEALIRSEQEVDIASRTLKAISVIPQLPPSDLRSYKDKLKQANIHKKTAARSLLDAVTGVKTAYTLLQSYARGRKLPNEPYYYNREETLASSEL